MNGNDRLEVFGRGENVDGATKERVAVVCPGPGASLIRGSEHTYHRIVAVNRGILGTALVSSWVCLDAHTVEWVYETCPDFLGPLRAGGCDMSLVCSLAVYREMGALHVELGNLTNVEHTSLDLGTTDIPWRKFGATVAMAVAAAGPARRAPVGQIDVFGVGWSGDRDFDGFSADRQRRDDDRWTEDKKVWLATVRLLLARGIIIRRMVHELREVLP